MKDDIINQDERYKRKSKINKEIDCLKSIVVNITKSDKYNGYPNRDIYISPWTALNIRLRLAELRFRGNLIISGIKDPCNHPEIFRILKTLSDKSEFFYPLYRIELFTNGIPEIDYREIYNMGIKIFITVNDTKDIEYLKYKFSDILVTFKNRTIKPDSEYSINKNLKESCNYPFFKMVIDTDGSYLLCTKDIEDDIKSNKHNIKNESIEQYFCNEIFDIKKDLLKNGREKLIPCRYCKYNTTLGKEEVEWFKSKYKI